MGVVKGFDELDGSRRQSKDGYLDPIYGYITKEDLIKKAFNLSHGKGKRKRKHTNKKRR